MSYEGYDFSMSRVVLNSIFSVGLIALGLYWTNYYTPIFHSKNIEPQYQASYDKFIREAKKRGVDFSHRNVEIVTQPETKSEAAHCMFTWVRPSIRISKLVDPTPELLRQQELAIIHELSHCFYLAPHSGQSPIMEPYLETRFKFYDMNEEEALNIHFDAQYSIAEYINTYDGLLRVLALRFSLGCFGLAFYLIIRLYLFKKIRGRLWAQN